jgi:cation diffusion facilitator CzcD-associated flavoprotein CzcO
MTTAMATVGAGTQARKVRVLIIGTGFSGLCAAIKLKAMGEHDIVLLERASAIGGTWRDNTYPGCACDVPAHLYSFSFELNPLWSHTFAPGPEIWAYLERCVDKYDLRRHVVFQQTVKSARLDAAQATWRIETHEGTAYEAQYVIVGIGGLSNASLPKIEGASTFAGAQFHTAAWDHSISLTGQRVGVIGTGASAIQVVPAIAPIVKKLVLFQRTPPWVLPRMERRYSDGRRWLFTHYPAAMRLLRGAIYRLQEGITPWLTQFRDHPRGQRFIERMARYNIERSIHDPALRERLTPRYAPGCKRLLLSNDYYPALARDNVTLVSDPIARIAPQGPVTPAGDTHEVDILVYATGFAVSEYLHGLHIIGRDGRSLSDEWEHKPEAYLGTLTSGFPNLFFMTGPNTGLGTNSVVVMIEAQVALITSCLQALAARGARSIEVRADVQRRYNEDVQRRLSRTVWNSGGCRSWYLDDSGHNYTLWPGTTSEFRARTQQADPEDYLFTP